MMLRFLRHAFAIRRRSYRQAQVVRLAQWSQWCSSEARRREATVEAARRARERLRLVSMRCARCRTMMEAVDREGRCNKCGFEVTHSIGYASRGPMLFGVSMLAMGGLGALAMIVALVRDSWSTAGSMDLAELGGEGFLVLVSFIIGGFVGVFSSPLVVAGLTRRDLRVALPFVYGGGAIVTAGYALVGDTMFSPLDCAVPAFVTVCILSLVAAVACPTLKLPEEGLCRECGYDLRGNVSGVCPECGAAAGAANVESREESGVA